MSECVVTLLDEVNCIISGLSPDHMAYFYELYGAYANNYFFNPKFKLGTWDGRIRFFHKNGKTFVNLLDELLPKIIGLKYKIKVNDKRMELTVRPSNITEDFFGHITEPDYNLPWKFRDYQIEAVNAVFKHGGGIIVAGTGAGKTSICAAIAKSYEIKKNLRSIIIVPDKSLTRQTKSEYAFFDLDVGEYSGDTKEIDHQHVVSTWQALKNNPSVLHNFDVVIVDECHNLRGPVIHELLINHGKNIAYRFGVTGTMPKGEADRMSVTVAVGTVQYEITAIELIRAGHLAKLHIDIDQLEEDLREDYKEYLSENPPEPLTYIKFKNEYFSEYTQEKSFLQKKKTRLDWIAKKIVDLSNEKKGNVFCLVNGVAIGKKLAKLIPDSHFVYGKDDDEVREKVYSLFKEHDNIIVFATCHIASTGLNIKRIFNLVLIDLGKSFIRTIQSIGRGLRKAPDKDFVLVTDICSDFKYGKRHVNERIKFYNEAEYPFSKKKIPYEKLNCDFDKFVV